MSKIQKSRKVRRPNIPLPVEADASVGTASVTLEPRVASSSAINADYTHIKKDLARILTLAGVLIASLVALSFFIK